MNRKLTAILLITAVSQHPQLSRRAKGIRRQRPRRSEAHARRKMVYRSRVGIACPAGAGPAR